MKIIAFKYGTTEITEKMAFQAGDENVKLPIALLFFLIENNNKKILIDVGCNTMPGFELFEHELPVNVLETYGVKRTEITDVIITHSHHDHVDDVGSYPSAIVHIHENELKSAESYLKDTEKIVTFDEIEKIDDIEIKCIGGHSKGSSIVLVNCGKDTYVFCGDECYTKENLIENKITGCSVNIEKSIAFTEEYRKDKYIPILFHDPDLVPELGYKVLYED
jgi:glyoxylase-like metal-dependent hydrolase (beta-lactamase superfamily II)